MSNLTRDLERAEGASALTAADIAAHAAGSFVRTPAVSVEQIIGFRIMRETEIAPSWWAQAREIGETVSAAVADKFCTEQNNVTMNPNRVKRHRYYADPIYTEPTPAATS